MTKHPRTLHDAALVRAALRWWRLVYDGNGKLYAEPDLDKVWAAEEAINRAAVRVLVARHFHQRTLRYLCP